MLDDINNQLFYQKSLPDIRQETREELEHDIMLWHYVRNQRRQELDVPVRARYWIATIDLSFLDFDNYKRKTYQTNIPICLTPAQFVQMLQLWVPRNPKLEEAILSSLRLPLLFQPFAPEVESVIVEILSVLSSYENAAEMSVEEISNVLTDQALRQHLKDTEDVEQQRERVKEVMIESNKRALVDRDAAYQQAEQARIEVSEKNRIINDLTDRLRNQEDAAKKIEADLTTERQSRISLDEQFAELRVTIEDERKRVAERKVRVRFLLMHALLSAGVIVVALTMPFLLRISHSSVAGRHVQLPYWQVSLISWALLMIGLVWLTDRHIVRETVVFSTEIGEKFHNFKHWIFAIFGALVLGVTINGVSKWIGW